MKQLLTLFTLIALALSVTLFFPRCAVIVAPDGGPKDTIPPVLVKSDPLPFSTDFKKNRVSLIFNEYIKLDRLNEKFVLSPPQKQNPEIKIKGKGLDIKFAEPLTDSTTYYLFFADAIQDNNEGNPLDNFQFAFSTGSDIDSLHYVGMIIDAFTLEPQPGVLVMLYEEFQDSIPIVQMPRHATKTNKSGVFFLSGLKRKDYKIFALVDKNANYLFDQKSESIAYSSEPIMANDLLTPSHKPVRADSIYTLWLFLEKDLTLSLTDFSRRMRQKIELVFTQPQANEVKIKPLNIPEEDLTDWYIKGSSKQGDSLTFWITNSDISSRDSLWFEVTYQKTDSIYNLYTQIDTLRFFYSDPKAKETKSRASSKSEEPEEKVVYQPMSSSVQSKQKLLPNQRIWLNFNMPQLSLVDSCIHLMHTKDSTQIPLLPAMQDSLNPTKYSLAHLWESEADYTLSVFPGAFVNLDGHTNDTLIIKFAGANPENFGIINFKLQGVTQPMVVQLMADKNKVIAERLIDTSGVVTFDYVHPSKYWIRVIVDANGNGIWDTGKYLDGIQPEKILIYEDDAGNKDIQIRANWEYDLNFNLKSEQHVSSDELLHLPDQ